MRLPWILSAASLVACGAHDPGLASPHALQFEQTELHLGSMRAGATVEARFPFSNPQQMPAELRAILTSCACSSVHVQLGGEIYASTPAEAGGGWQRDGRSTPSIQVPARALGVAVLAIDTTGADGDKSGTAQCFRADTNLAPQILRWRLHVEPWFRAHPREFVFEDAAAIPKRFILQIERIGSGKHVPTSATVGPAGAVLALQELREGIWQTAATADHLAGDSLERLARIEVATSVPGVWLEVPITVRLQPAILVSPGTRIHAGRLARNSNVELLVSMRAADAAWFTIEPARDSTVHGAPVTLTWQARSACEAGHHDLLARIRTGDRRGIFLARTWIHTSHPGQREVLLAFHGSVQ